MLYSLQILLITPVIFVLLYLVIHWWVKGERSVCIVVLGDIGRSPRMQYHALSLAEHGFDVNIVGYGGSEPHHRVKDNENIELNIIGEAPKAFSYLPGPLGYVFRALWLATSLSFTLLLLPKCRYFFVQNPPTIPTLPVVWFVCLVRNSVMVVDWHNYGYTILSLKVGAENILVSIYQRIERLFGRQAWASICVTNAMKQDLDHHWDIPATTVYDRPPDIFKTAMLKEQHELFTRLAKQYPVFRADSSSESSNLFTQMNSKGVISRAWNRPALLVSSTSWTEDEDFGLLLEALEYYDNTSSESHPRILCVITGKGPQKEMYRKEIEERSWRKILFCLPWLTAEDYPLLLGSADVGVCLHRSSSGLDLPMKVVDMFGCGLPVCAVCYDCIEELVRPDYNGLLFLESEQLSDQLKELLMAFPDKSFKLKKFRENLKEFQASRWNEQWKKKVLPIFIGKNKRD